MICFESISPIEFPVDFYELSIYDVTGEREYLYQQFVPENCTLVEHIFSSTICAPFKITVSAYNLRGQSDYALKTIGNTRGKNYFVS